MVTWTRPRNEECNCVEHYSVSLDGSEITIAECGTFSSVVPGSKFSCGSVLQTITVTPVVLGSRPLSSKSASTSISYLTLGKPLAH